MDRLSLIAAIVMRDGDCCYICSQGQDRHDPWEVEHVKPRKMGGTDDLANLALAHRSCNRSKGIAAVIRSAPSG
jgi:5-methylcytosine-specific restriction endonuclease McrA